MIINANPGGGGWARATTDAWMMMMYASELRFPRFPVAQLEKPGKSLGLIPGSLWQQ